MRSSGRRGPDRARHAAALAAALAFATATVAAAVARAQAEDDSTEADTGVRAAFGLGLGVPYGTIGFGADVGLPHVSLIGGVGTTVFAGPGWGAGLRAHLLDRSHRFRPHFSALYGVTGVVVDVLSDEGHALKGFAFYAGVDHDAGDPDGFVLTYGLGYLTHEAPPPEVEDEDEGPPIKLLFGVNYRF